MIKRKIARSGVIESRVDRVKVEPMRLYGDRRCVSQDSAGDLFTYMQPRVVAEINVTDLQPESGDGEPVRTMALQCEPDSGWKSISQMPLASWLHPVLVRLRDDKMPGGVDTGFAQILERCLVDQASSQVAQVQLSAIVVLKHKVWTKRKVVSRTTPNILSIFPPNFSPTRHPWPPQQ